jgi:hypothetical protein
MLALRETVTADIGVRFVAVRVGVVAVRATVVRCTLFAVRALRDDTLAVLVRVADSLLREVIVRARSILLELLLRAGVFFTVLLACVFFFRFDWLVFVVSVRFVARDVFKGVSDTAAFSARGAKHAIKSNFILFIPSL